MPTRPSVLTWLSRGVVVCYNDGRTADRVAPAVSHLAREASMAAKRILIVDDEPGVLDVSARTLRKAGTGYFAIELPREGNKAGHEIAGNAALLEELLSDPDAADRMLPVIDQSGRRTVLRIFAFDNL